MSAKFDTSLVLVPFIAPVNPVDEKGALPERKKILNWGVNPTVRGPVIVSDETVRVFNAVQAQKGRDLIALDYEHNTVRGTPAWKDSKEPREVAAFCRAEVIPGEGVFIFNIEPTPSGKTNARNYCDLSPAAEFLRGTNIVGGLHSVALCRQGAVNDLRIFSMEATMDCRLMLATLLNLGADVADEQLQQAYDAAMAASAAEATAEEGPDMATMSADLLKLTTQVATLTAEVAASRQAAAAATSAVQALSVEASTTAKATLLRDDLREHIASLQPTVPLQRLTPVETFTVEAGEALLRQFNAETDPARRSALWAKIRNG
jgi:hypothetical protein